VGEIGWSINIFKIKMKQNKRVMLKVSGKLHVDHEVQRSFKETGRCKDPALMFAVPSFSWRV
jgi:hypothetical protein